MLPRPASIESLFSIRMEMESGLCRVGIREAPDPRRTRVPGGATEETAESNSSLIARICAPVGGVPGFLLQLCKKGMVTTSKANGPNQANWFALNLIGRRYFPSEIRRRRTEN